MVFFVFWCAIFIVLPLHVFIVKTKKQYWSVIISEIRPYFHIPYSLCICFVNNPWRISKTSSVSSRGLILLLTMKVSNRLAHPQQWLVELTTGLGKAHKHIHTPITWREHQQSAEQQHTYLHSLQVAHETQLRSKCCHSHTISTNSIVSFLTAGMCNTKADSQRNCTLATNQN